LKQLKSHSIDVGKIVSEASGEPTLTPKQSVGGKKQLENVNQEAVMERKSDTPQSPQQVITGETAEMNKPGAISDESSMIDTKVLSTLQSIKTAEETNQLDIVGQTTSKISASEKTGTPMRPLQVDSQKIVEAKQSDIASTISPKTDKIVMDETTPNTKKTAEETRQSDTVSLKTCTQTVSKKSCCSREA